MSVSPLSPHNESASPRPPRVLVVDDESTICHVIKHVLEAKGCEVITAGTGEDGLVRAQENTFDVAMLDIILPGINGIEVLTGLKARFPDIHVIMMTSHASVETAIQAIRKGAYDYIHKPFDDIDDIWHRVSQAYDKRRLLLENRELLEKQTRLNERITESVMRLCALIDTGLLLSQYQTLDELLEFFADLVATHLGSERITVLLLDDDGYLRVRSSIGLPDSDLAPVQIPLGTGLVGMVCKHGKPERLDAPGRATPVALASDAFMGAPIAICAPLRASERVIGVLCVSARGSGDPYSDEDFRYLVGLAAQAAVAIERVRHAEVLQRAFKSLKEAHEQLVAVEKLKALGQLAAGVAHDLNNTLNVVLGRAQLLLRDMDFDTATPEQVRAGLDAIEKAAHQGAETIKLIQDFTRIRVDAPTEATDLNRVVSEAIEAEQPHWNADCNTRGITIDLDLDLGDIPSIVGSHYELMQVVKNLLFNALEAMPRGGTLSFRTALDGDVVQLEVADTGDGMPPEIAERIFEPFFTTKADGHGIGLSLVFGVVSRHQGTVTVDSTVGSGTRCVVRLPLAPAGAAPGDSRPAAPVSRMRTPPPSEKRVLIVDDDAQVLETNALAIRSIGCQVLTLNSGHEALMAVQRTAFDLVVTDLNMPVMSGLELAQRLKAMQPDLAIVLLSGWSAQQEHDTTIASCIDRVLAKPCDLKTLVDTVAGVLERPLVRKAA